MDRLKEFTFTNEENLFTFLLGDSTPGFKVIKKCSRLNNVLCQFEKFQIESQEILPFTNKSENIPSLIESMGIESMGLESMGLGGRFDSKSFGKTIVDLFVDHISPKFKSLPRKYYNDGINLYFDLFNNGISLNYSINIPIRELEDQPMKVEYNDKFPITVVIDTAFYTF